MGCNAWHVPTLHAKANQHLRRWRTLCKRSGLTCFKAQINAAILSFLNCSRHVKAVGGHFKLAVWIDVTSINMSCFFTIIKTVLSCNWTDQLLFTYKMALCTSHSHSFVYWLSIVIKFMYLTDIYLAINWWKIQQNMPGCFLEIPVFLFFYVTPCILRHV